MILREVLFSMIFHDCLPKNAGVNKKGYCEILYEKIIPVYNKTIRDIIEREGANSPLLSTEKSETPPPPCLIE